MLSFFNKYSIKINIHLIIDSLKLVRNPKHNFIETFSPVNRTKMPIFKPHMG